MTCLGADWTKTKSCRNTWWFSHKKCGKMGANKVWQKSKYYIDGIWFYVSLLLRMVPPHEAPKPKVIPQWNLYVMYCQREAYHSSAYSNKPPSSDETRSVNPLKDATNTGPILTKAGWAWHATICIYAYNLWALACLGKAVYVYMIPHPNMILVCLIDQCPMKNAFHVLNLHQKDPIHVSYLCFCGL